MKVKSRVLSTFVALPFLCAPLAATAAQAEPDGSHCMMGHAMKGMGHGNMAFKDKAKFDVSNDSNGVTLKVTSDDPEAVKQIQQHFANFGKFHQESAHPGADGQE